MTLPGRGTQGPCAAALEASWVWSPSAGRPREVSAMPRSSALALRPQDLPVPQRVTSDPCTVPWQPPTTCLGRGVFKTTDV